MKNIKMTALQILFSVILFSNTLYAGSQFNEVEKALEERNYINAEHLFNVLKNENKSKRSDIRNMEKDTISFLKLIDKNLDYMKSCDDYTCNQIDTKKINSKFGVLKYSAKYYSKNFKNKLYDLYITTFNKSKEYNKVLVKEKNEHNKQARLARAMQKSIDNAKAKEDQAIYIKNRNEKFKKEQRLREETKQKEIDDAKKEDNRIDKKAKKLGFTGYSKMNISQLIYKTQKNGGLENYINSVVGCSALDKVSCNRLNSKLQILQILDNGLIYHFYKYTNNEPFEYMIFTNKLKSKIYQEKQKIDDGFYVFRGMIKYTTILGIQKSIPKFEKVNIK